MAITTAPQSVQGWCNLYGTTTSAAPAMAPSTTESCTKWTPPASRPYSTASWEERTGGNLWGPGSSIPQQPLWNHRVFGRLLQRRRI
jgi:hypothetical protein